MNYDFLTTYFPAASELSADRMRQMREAAAILTRAVYPDIDTSPNSPAGDLLISPAGPALAAAEEAMNRWMSDFNPEQIAAGIVWNCDFVSDFLLNFGIHDESYQQSYAVLRLTFSSAEQREIDRSTEFQIAGGVYRIFVPKPGPLTLLPPGLPAPDSDSDYCYRNYSYLGDSSWIVDVLVFGTAGVTSTTPQTASVDRQLEGLVSAVTLGTVMGGTTPDRLQELARRVRNNFHSRTPTTRGGAVNMIHQQFPELTITGCVISGDPEMSRDIANPSQVAVGCLDLMVRSAALLTDTATVKLRQMTDAAGDIVFAGWLDLPETPVKLLSVSQGSEAFDRTVYSVSENEAVPALSAAYGKDEKLWIAVPYVASSAGDPLIQTFVENSAVYAYFKISYMFDPALKMVQEFVADDSQAAAGLSMYVRWFVPVVVDLLEVGYNRKAGTTFNIDSARANILTDMNSHRFEAPFSPALIDAALYYAGAHSVSHITMTASVRYSVADKVWTGGVPVMPTDTSSWIDFEAGCEDVPSLAVNTLYEPSFDYADLTDDTFAVSGPRNISYLISSAALRLVEQRSL